MDPEKASKKPGEVQVLDKDVDRIKVVKYMISQTTKVLSLAQESA